MFIAFFMCVSTSLLSMCFFIFSSSYMCLSLSVISSTSLSLMSSVSTSSIYMNGISLEGGGALRMGSKKSPLRVGYISHYSNFGYETPQDISTV